MDPNMTKQNELLAEKVAKGPESRSFRALQIAST